MSVSRYVNLIEEFSTCAGINAGNFLNNGYLLLNDTLFTFIAPHSDEDSRFHVYCDFGLLPREKKARTYRQLLEANLLLGHFCCFSINAETRHVILHFQPELAGMTGAVLLANLWMFAVEARRWRTTHDITANHLRAHDRHAQTYIAATLIKQRPAAPARPKRKPRPETA